MSGMTKDLLAYADVVHDALVHIANCDDAVPTASETARNACVVITKLRAALQTAQSEAAGIRRALEKIEAWKPSSAMEEDTDVYMEMAVACKRIAREALGIITKDKARDEQG